MVVPAGGPGPAGGEELLGPVHEAVRLRLEVEGDVVGGAERGLPVAHPAEEAEAAVEAEVVATPASEGLDDRLVVVPAGGPGPTGGEQLLGPVHEAVRLRLEVEGDVVGGAERGLPVAHPPEEAIEAKVVATPDASTDVLVAGDDLVRALKAGRHSQSGGGAAVAQAAAVASRAPRSDAELEGKSW